MLFAFDEGDYGQVVRENSGRFGAEPGGGKGLTSGLCALFTSTPGWPPVRVQVPGPLSSLLAGCLQSAPPPPSLATGLAMKSPVKDVSKGSQMGLADSNPVFGEVELTSPCPVARDLPGPHWCSVPLRSSWNKMN